MVQALARGRECLIPMVTMRSKYWLYKRSVAIKPADDFSRTSNSKDTPGWRLIWSPYPVSTILREQATGLSWKMAEGNDGQPAQRDADEFGLFREHWHVTRTAGSPRVLNLKFLLVLSMDNFSSQVTERRSYTNPKYQRRQHYTFSLFHGPCPGPKAKGADSFCWPNLVLFRIMLKCPWMAAPFLLMKGPTYRSKFHNLGYIVLSVLI